MVSPAPPGYRFPNLPPLAIAMVAVLMGCLLDGIIKHLGDSYSAVLIAFGRYVFGTIFAAMALVALKVKLPSGMVLRGHALRAVATTISAVLFFHSLTILPIAEATVLMFCAPLMIAPLAWWLLGEKLRAVAMVALVIGFAGAIITVQGQPDDGDQARRLEGVLSGLGGALLYAFSVVLLRRFAQRDDPVMTSFLGSFFPAVYLVIPVVILGVYPRFEDFPALAGTGLLGFTLWFLLTVAYSRAPAQRLAAAEYTALIWSALIGYVFFAETPEWQVWLGAGVIVTAVMLSAWDGRRAEKIPAPAATPAP